MSIPDPARLVIAALRLDRWSRAEVEDRADAALDLGTGGFILFGGEADDVRALTARLRAEAAHALWIGADLERGAGQQFRGLSELPPPAALAELGEAAEVCREAGRLTGQEALSVGVNWVLAPVLDLDAERENPIVATRSFSSDPARVAALGEAWIRGCQDAGAIACAKHFPGHGRTRDDSHIGLPVVEADRETLATDVAPFAAVTGVVGSMMAAHVAFPALGSSRPATIAPEIATDLLRGVLGFEGPLATDAMIMGAVGEDDAAAAVVALLAGCDLILYPSDVARTVEALRRAVETEPAARRATEAAGRAAAALASAAPGGTPSPLAPLDLAVRTIRDAAEGLDGWRADAPTRVLAVSDDPDVGPPAGREGPLGEILAAGLRDAGWPVVGGTDAAEQCVVVLAATPRGWKGHGGPAAEALADARALARSAPRGLVVLLGHARWLDDLAVPGICAWSTETIMERAAARWIHATVTGR